MIDYIKLVPKDKQDFENTILENAYLNITSTYDMANNVQTYPYKAIYNGMQVSLNENFGSLGNSLHKYYNSTIANLGSHNYNDFNYCEIKHSIEQLEKDFNVSLKHFKVVPLEFGLNIETNYSPIDIISNMTFSYDNNSFNTQRFNGVDSSIVYDLNDTKVKFYDKGLQYNLKNNILRMEVKYKTSRIINKFNIYSTYDLLNKSNFKLLFADYLSRFNKLVIIDNINSVELTESEKQYLSERKSIHFWKDLKKNKSTGNYYNKKKEFDNFLKEKNLLSVKTEIGNKLELKFNELLNPLV